MHDLTPSSLNLMGGIQPQAWHTFVAYMILSFVLVLLVVGLWGVLVALLLCFCCPLGKGLNTARVAPVRVGSGGGGGVDICFVWLPSGRGDMLLLFLCVCFDIALHGLALNVIGPCIVPLLGFVRSPAHSEVVRVPCILMDCIAFSWRSLQYHGFHCGIMP